MRVARADLAEARADGHEVAPTAISARRARILRAREELAAVEQQMRVPASAKHVRRERPENRLVRREESPDVAVVEQDFASVQLGQDAAQ